MLTQGLHSLPQAPGLHLLPGHNAQELPVELGLVVVLEQLLSLKETSLLVPPKALWPSSPTALLWAPQEWAVPQAEAARSHFLSVGCWQPQH